MIGGSVDMIQIEATESPAVKLARMFGEIAIEMGFLTTEQFEDAVNIQCSSEAIPSVKQRKLIGDILFENNWMTVEQIYIVQRHLFHQQSDLPIVE